jgi:hypothetical protein
MVQTTKTQPSDTLRGAAKGIEQKTAEASSRLKTGV